MQHVPVVFHSGTNYVYYFIINEFPNSCNRKFECLGENAEEYKTFSFPIETEVTKIDKSIKMVIKVL